MLLVAGALTSCGGDGGDSGGGGTTNPTPVTTDVTITARSASTSHVATFALTVR